MAMNGARIARRRQRPMANSAGHSSRRYHVVN